MNRIVILLAVIGGFLFTSCQEDEIMVFGYDHYVYFDKYWKDESYPGTAKADTTTTTFFFLDENINSLDVDLMVVLAGRKLEKDLDFKLRVVPEQTTALPEEYTLADHYTFRALPVKEGDTRFQDTIRIQLNRSSRIEQLEKGYCLVLEIVPDENVKVGPYERSRCVIQVIKDPIRPAWWDKEIEETLLGDYSSVKYKLFLQHVPGAYELDEDLIKNNPDQVRKLALEFKKWLQENPSVDENGNPITVEV